MPLERAPLFRIESSVIDRVHADSQIDDTSHLSIIEDHMKLYQPYLFANYKSTSVKQEYSEAHYASAVFYMYDILRQGTESLPINISVRTISPDILNAHEVKADEIFNDSGWGNNDWIMSQLNQLPVESGYGFKISVIEVTKHSELFNFFDRLRAVSPEFARLVYDTVISFETPIEKKSFLRGVFDIFNPYYSLVDAQNLSDSMWIQENKAQLDGMGEKYKEEAVGETTSIEKIISCAEGRLRQKYLEDSQS